MTQTSSPWDGLLVGDASAAPYSADEWAHFWALRHGAGSIFPDYGVLLGTGDTSYSPLFVSAAGSANVNVNIGAALVNGKIYETDAAVSLTVGANASGNPRIDLVVLRTDYTAQTIRAVIKQGTPAVSPTVPALTQSASLWEIPLAQIAVANGFSTIASTDIVDLRRYVNVTGAGWQPFAYPVNANPIDPYTSAYTLPSGAALAMPIVLAGNMLVERLMTIGRGANSPVVTWGLYVQDTDNGQTAEKTVRRLGGSETTSTTSIVSGSPAYFPATPGPFAVPPGAYWLVVKTAGANMSIGTFTAAASSFNSGAHNVLYKSAPGTLGQTLDLVTGWMAFPAESDDAYAFRLDGRVLGMTTAL